MDFVADANKRYENLANPERVFHHGLSDPAQNETLVSALNIFKSDWIHSEHLADLRRVVSKGYWFGRLPYFFSTTASSKLDELDLEVNSQIEIHKGFLGPEEVDLLTRYSTSLRALAGEPPTWEALARDLRELGDNLLITVEQSRWSNDLQSFASGIGNSANVVALGSIGYLAKVQPGKFQALAFLGNPMAISVAHSRLLFCSGLAPQTHCWIPGKSGFSTSDLENHVFGNLSPTLALPGFRPKTFAAEPAEVSATLDEVSRKVSIAASTREFDLERLGSSGTESCFLLRIDEDAVIPIEADASRVSTLVLDQLSGRVNEEQIDWPLSGSGAIVFALVEQGEQDFLWEAAKLEMGSHFYEFAELREEWLRALRVFVDSVGVNQAEYRLGLAGVATAPHLTTWLSNDKFTRPRADADFRALLNCILPDETKIIEIMRLTSQFRGELNQVAKTARKLVCEALDSENWADLQAGENLHVLLEEFGDVAYRVGKVIEISQEPVLVPSSQVRRVLGG